MLPFPRLAECPWGLGGGRVELGGIGPPPAKAGGGQFSPCTRGLMETQTAPFGASGYFPDTRMQESRSKVV